MTDLPYLRDEAQAEEWRKNAQQLQKRAYLGWDAVRDTTKELPIDVVGFLEDAERSEQRWRDLSGDRESCLFAQRGCAPEGPGLAWCQRCSYEAAQRP